MTARIALTILVTAVGSAIADEIHGYFVDIQQESFEIGGAQVKGRDGSEAAAALSPEELSCPSENVISTRYRCKVSGAWTDCSRQSCCPGYTLILGRCVSASIDPCSIEGICEHNCDVYFGRVVCTCRSGFRFDAERYEEEGGVAACVDVDECLSQEEEEGEERLCEQVCTNTEGGYECSCREGFRLDTGDNSSCVPEEQAGHMAGRHTFTSGPEGGGGCVASCRIVKKLKTHVENLEERVRSLGTAIRLYSMSAGAPGPPGPPGVPGPPGERGFRGAPGGRRSQFRGRGGGSRGEEEDEMDDADEEEDDYVEDLLDSYRLVKQPGGRGRGGKRKKHFCRCRRGPVGPPGAAGATGERGLRGPQGSRGLKGEPGSFDFLMLMVADIRHDIERLNSRVLSPSDSEQRYDLEQHLEWERKMREWRHRKEAEAMEAANFDSDD